MTDASFEDLVSRLLDDDLSSEEVSELVALTRDHPERHDDLRAQLGTAEMLSQSEDELRDGSLFVAALRSRIGDERFVSGVRSGVRHIDAREAKAARGVGGGRHDRFREGGSSRDGNTAGTHVARWPLAVATAAVVVLIVNLAFFQPDVEAVIARITRLNGSVQWTGDGGRLLPGIESGRELSGGTLETLHPDAWTELRFHDGSAVTVSGMSALTISEREQKALHLRYGSLSADVAAQQPGLPMLVHTPTAELEVLGTRFNVDAGPSRTVLSVNEGHVRLRRLADGELVDVPAGHQVIASAEDEGGLAVRPRGEGRASWQGDLKGDVVHGRWAPDLWSLGQKLKKAVASGEISEHEAVRKYKDAARLDDPGSVWATPSPSGLLVLLSVSREFVMPVVLAPESGFRIRGRVHSRVDAIDVIFGFTTREIGGGFSGKYSVSVSVSTVQAGGGAFDIDVPLGQFRDHPESDSAPAGHELTDWWCHTVDRRSKLEITGVELLVR